MADAAPAELDVSRAVSHFLFHRELSGDFKSPGQTEYSIGGYFDLREYADGKNVPEATSCNSSVEPPNGTAQ